MALLLCKIVPGTTQDVHVQHATIDYFSFWPISRSYNSYVCFLMEMTDITRTLTLFFILLLHLKADATIRVEGFTLCYSGLCFLWCHKLAEKYVKPKMFLLVVSGLDHPCYFFIVCKRYTNSMIKI